MRSSTSSLMPASSRATAGHEVVEPVGQRRMVDLKVETSPFGQFRELPGLFGEPLQVTRPALFQSPPRAADIRLGQPLVLIEQLRGRREVPRVDQLDQCLRLGAAGDQAVQQGDREGGVGMLVRVVGEPDQQLTESETAGPGT